MNLKRNIMTTIKKLENATIFTTFDNDMNMIGARMETKKRSLQIDLGRVTKTWTIILDSKTNKTAMGHNKNLRTYVNQPYNSAINYWDKKLKEFNV